MTQRWERRLFWSVGVAFSLGCWWALYEFATWALLS